MREGRIVQNSTVWLVGGAASLGALGGGAAVAILAGQPPMVQAVGAGLLGVGTLSLLARPCLPRIFVGALGCILVGYAFLGRGFAYAGYYPVFIGEVILLIAFFVAVMSTGRTLRQSWLVWLLILFLFWGAVRTVPYIRQYELDALRDSVTWAYGVYAVAVAAALARMGGIRRFVVAYGWVLPVFLIWTPLAYLLYQTQPDLIPRWPWGPGGGVPIANPKGGDIAVHLAGAAAFAVLNPKTPGPAFVLWPAWFAAAALVAFTGRGALLSILAGLGVVITLRPRSRWYRVAGMMLVGLTLLWVADFSLDFGTGRQVSVDQLVRTAQSVLGESEDPGLEGTKVWRLAWWSTIFDYTLRGEYFWTGKGFGVNLADDDGFQVTADRSLRSPHNSHLTILARAGVPGFALWILLQLGFAAALLRCYIVAVRGGAAHDASMATWLLAYWAAFTVNGMFDVFLEGPQGGIWFWTVYGVGLTLVCRADRPRHALKRT